MSHQQNDAMMSSARQKYHDQAEIAHYERLSECWKTERGKNVFPICRKSKQVNLIIIFSTTFQRTMCTSQGNHREITRNSLKNPRNHLSKYKKSWKIMRYYSWRIQKKSQKIWRKHMWKINGNSENSCMIPYNIDWESCIMNRSTLAANIWTPFSSWLDLQYSFWSFHQLAL